MKYALVNSDKVVVNIIEWDGNSEFSIPYLIIRSDEAEINDVYNPESNSFLKPVQGDSQ